MGALFALFRMKYHHELIETRVGTVVVAIMLRRTANMAATSDGRCPSLPLRIEKPARFWLSSAGYPRILAYPGRYHLHPAPTKSCWTTHNRCSSWHACCICSCQPLLSSAPHKKRCAVRDVALGHHALDGHKAQAHIARGSTQTSGRSPHVARRMAVV